MTFFFLHLDIKYNINTNAVTIAGGNKLINIFCLAFKPSMKHHPSLAVDIVLVIEKSNILTKLENNIVYDTYDNIWDKAHNAKYFCSKLFTMDSKCCLIISSFLLIHYTINLTTNSFFV